MRNAEQVAGQDASYREASRRHAAGIERLARAYEADAELRRDLVQEIHVALWRSFARFERGCSERTWVYRVAHNVAASHVAAGRRGRASGVVALDDVQHLCDDRDAEAEAGSRLAIDRLFITVGSLKPTDRQVALLYLEELSAIEIAEVTGLTSGAIAVRIHRIKGMLARIFAEGTV